MPPIELIGGSYTSASVSADCQRCINFYVEMMESGTAKSRKALYRTPGTKKFATLAGMRAVVQEFPFAGRLFAIGEDLTWQYIFEVFADGTAHQIGKLGVAGGLSSFAPDNASQLVFTSARRLFLLNLKTNALSEIDTTHGTALQAPVIKIDFSDGYIVAALTDGRFQISNLLDASVWDPLDISKESVFADTVTAMLIDHREIWFWSPTKSIVYEDTGNPLFPFEPNLSGFIESGIIAPASATKLDNSLFWLSGDERGAGLAVRADGYRPTRVSTHAIENEWQSYPTIADADGYAYQDRGHTFWQLRFPSANKTWVYDVATGLWAERAWGAMADQAHHSRCHAFVFGKHLVGDWASGNIYEMSTTFLDDDGTPIRRIRRAPHTHASGQRFAIDKLRIDVETGVGPQPPLLDGNGNPREPQMMLRTSSDNGHSWSQELTRGCGQMGQFKRRVIWRRLGTHHDWVPEISVTDPVPWAIVDGGINEPD